MRGMKHSSRCGQRWIRTTEVERQQIYSLPHLATLEFAQMSSPLKDFAKILLFSENANGFFAIFLISLLSLPFLWL